MNMLRRFTVVITLVTIAAVINAGVAMAARPQNDTEANAVVVDTVPFTHSTDTTRATAGGPTFCSNSASAFYRFTPSSDVRIQVDLLGSDYDTTLGVYARDDAGRVHVVTCNDDRLGWDAGVRMRAEAGTTYYFMAGRCCRSGRSGGGELVFSLSRPVSEPLAVSFSFADAGTVDDQGIAEIAGTFTCNKRVTLWAEGRLRQLRQGIFVARAWLYGEGVCAPGEPLEVSIEVETETSVVFGPGVANASMHYIDSYAGWDEYVSLSVDESEPITLS
jgi:hypothetical protein